MKELDQTDRRLLLLLQEDDRRGLADLGREVGLAASSVNERIKRLTERGVITGFHARLAPEALGLDLLTFVFVGWDDPGAETPFLERVAGAGAVLECHHITGAWNYLLKVRLRNTRELEHFLGSVVKRDGVLRTDTIIALSSPKETTALPTARAQEP
jgi:Lrp/AsnC family transcriptional regulator, leucine-responsive regulatory protein